MSQTTSTSSTEQSQGQGGGQLAARGGSTLVTEQGKTSIADSVVEKIAGIATRQVAGVHNMGAGATRAFGALKEKLPIGSSNPSPTQGVSVEVGERQAAIDLDIVVEYGVPIAQLADAVRRNVIQQVERMTGLEVTEVNISVNDVYLGETEDEEPRVQ